MSLLPLLLHALLVYEPSHPKVRMGIDYDGGYVAVNLTGVVTYDHCISGGVGHDNSFEIAMVDTQPGLTCDVYDHSISSLPQSDPRLTWHKQMVGQAQPDVADNLHSYLNGYSNLFVKMDIEGGEFPWLASVSNKQLKSIAQLLIEWHFVAKWAPWQWDILARLAKTHKLVHVHVCNCCGFDVIQGVKIPHVFECTYVRKDLEPSTTLSSAPIPGPLDMRNVQSLSDVNISWPPFVNPTEKVDL